MYRKRGETRVSRNEMSDIGRTSTHLNTDLTTTTTEICLSGMETSTRLLNGSNITHGVNRPLVAKRGMGTSVDLILDTKEVITGGKSMGEMNGGRTMDLDTMETTTTKVEATIKEEDVGLTNTRGGVIILIPRQGGDRPLVSRFLDRIVGMIKPMFPLEMSAVM